MPHASEAIQARQAFRDGLFDGRSVLVTGGATGIGFAIAQAFHGLGATVHLASRSQAHLDAASAALGNARVQTHVCDVRDRAQVDRAVAAATGDSPLHAVVNSAAGNFPAPFDVMSDNAWRTVVDIVLHGTANVCHAVRPRLAPQACLINIVAGYAWTGAAGVSHSGAAKAGVLNLTKSLAVEWAPAVRVNAVSPGPIDGTEGMKRLADELGLRPELTAAVPLGRLGHGREVADACVFLASPAASYVTGACLVIDGGMDAMGPFGGLLARAGGAGRG